MQKRHRIFIAINLPSDIKRVLARQEQKFADLPATWTPEENLHITLVFLGNLTDIELGEVCVAAKEVAARHQSFEINLQHIGYGPDDKIPFDDTRGKPPKMLWAQGEKSKELSALKTDLQNAFLEKINFTPDIKIFAPHVTLARIGVFAWRTINPEERPEVAQDIDMLFSVESIDVMESEMKRGGPEYTVIESINLNP